MLVYYVEKIKKNNISKYVVVLQSLTIIIIYFYTVK